MVVTFPRNPVAHARIHPPRITPQFDRIRRKRNPVIRVRRINPLVRPAAAFKAQRVRKRQPSYPIAVPINKRRLLLNPVVVAILKITVLHRRITSRVAPFQAVHIAELMLRIILEISEGVHAPREIIIEPLLDPYAITVAVADPRKLPVVFGARADIDAIIIPRIYDLVLDPVFRLINQNLLFLSGVFAPQRV